MIRVNINSWYWDIGWWTMLNVSGSCYCLMAGWLFTCLYNLFWLRPPSRSLVGHVANWVKPPAWTAGVPGLAIRGEASLEAERGRHLGPSLERATMIQTQGTFPHKACENAAATHHFSHQYQQQQHNHPFIIFPTSLTAKHLIKNCRATKNSDSTIKRSTTGSNRFGPWLSLESTAVMFQGKQLTIAMDGTQQ